MKEQRRLKNERKYKNWEELPTGGRRYWYDIVGRLGWISRYVKVVDDNENTTSFYQEVYDENSKLIELHHKYPEDKGHQKV
ncbi:MAG: hypothetical protein V3T79_02620 [Candidatus Scalindua sediminis]